MVENESLFLNGFQGYTNNNDYILGILDGNDKIDLIEIEARELLSKIKQMINANLLSNEVDKIDQDFIKSLKKLIVITNNNVTEQYLKKLSYIYYAIYNGTLDIYYKLSQEKNKIEYYMLDKNFYNKIYAEPINWKAYNTNILRYAYSNNCIEEVLKIFKINPNWYVNLNSELAQKVTKENLTNLFNEYGIELVANSDFELLNNYNEENKEYIHELLLINPKLQIQSSSLFDWNVKHVFDYNVIAFLTRFQQYDIVDLTTNILALKWYKEALEEKSDFCFENRYREPELVEWSLKLEIELPVKIYTKLNSSEISNLHFLFQLCIYPNSKFGLKEKIKLNNYLKELIKRYDDPKTLIKKV